MFDIPEATIVINTNQTGFGILKHEPFSTSGPDSKTTKVLNGGAGWSVGPVVRFTGGISHEIQHKSRAVNFKETRCGVQWIHSINGAEDRQTGLGPCEEKHSTRISFSGSSYEKLKKGNIEIRLEGSINISTD